MSRLQFYQLYVRRIRPILKSVDAKTSGPYVDLTVKLRCGDSRSTLRSVHRRRTSTSSHGRGPVLLLLLLLGADESDDAGVIVTAERRLHFGRTASTPTRQAGAKLRRLFQLAVALSSLPPRSVSLSVYVG